MIDCKYLNIHLCKTSYLLSENDIWVILFSQKIELIPKSLQEIKKIFLSVSSNLLFLSDTIGGIFLINWL